MNKEKVKVLYVDDEEGNLTAFKASFRRDFEVHTATSAEQGLALLAERSMHVVISDQRMPGTNGSQFLALVRQRYPDTIRMLLTGYSDMEAVVAAINEGGIYSYCTKPWDNNDLKLRIEQAHEVHSLREQRESLLQRYRQMFETSGDPMVITGMDRRIVEANPATLKLLGADLEAVRGSDFADLLSDPGVLQRPLDALRNGTPSASADLTVRTPGGRVIDGLATFTALGTSPDGEPLVQATIKDITDRKQEEQRLRKLNDDLDRRVSVRTRQLLDALEDLGSFSYTVAHDLRSPLKNILALSQHLAEDDAPGSSERGEASARIQRGAERMIQLVDDLLRFSQTNSREVQREDLNVADLLQRCITDHVPAERACHVTVQVDPDATLSGDPSMLNVALGNLLSNAIKYSRSVAAPTITMGHRIEAGEHHLWVRDNGVGFDGGKSEQVFGAFKRMHRNDQFEGTGVGLAIVQRIVSKHGGTATAESTPGEGTVITLRLPAQPQAAQSLPFAS